MAKIKASFEKEVEVGAPLRLEVTTGSGDISIDRGEDGKLRVTSEFEVRAGSQKEAEELARRIREDPPIEVEGDLVRVGSLGRYDLGRWPNGSSVVFDFSISAPMQSQARLRSGSGDQSVRNLKGPVTAKAGSGDILIEDVGGRVEIDTGSGDIAVARVCSSVDIGIGSGDLDLGEIDGEVSIRIGSGDARLRRLGGSLQVSGGSGDISLESAIPDGVEWILKAGSGDVELLLPGGSQFKLSAHSALGEMEAGFGLHVSGGAGKLIEGRVGDNPTSSITIKTAHGDIRIAAKQELMAAA